MLEATVHHGHTAAGSLTGTAPGARNLGGPLPGVAMHYGPSGAAQV